MKPNPSDTTGVRLLAEAAEAFRCWHIYRNPIAAARPGLAWAMLPTGQRVTETLLTLAQWPPEVDGPSDCYERYLDILTSRRDRAFTAWTAYSAHEEKTSVH